MQPLLDRHKHQRKMGPEPPSAASLVMSNPSAYPDFFLGVLLALDLDPVELDTFAKYSHS